MVVVKEMCNLLSKVLQRRMIFGVTRGSVFEPKRVLQGGESEHVFPATNKTIGQLPRVFCPPPDAQL